MATLENELSRAVSRLSGSISRLEKVIAVRQKRIGCANTSDLTMVSDDSQSLRELHHTVTGKLEEAIERLRGLVGEGGGGEEKRG